MKDQPTVTFAQGGVTLSKLDAKHGSDVLLPGTAIKNSNAKVHPTLILKRRSQSFNSLLVKELLYDTQQKRSGAQISAELTGVANKR